jgi:hypothetical protein
MLSLYTKRTLPVARALRWLPVESATVIVAVSSSPQVVTVARMALREVTSMAVHTSTQVY